MEGIGKKVEKGRVRRRAQQHYVSAKPFQPPIRTPPPQSCAPLRILEFRHHKGIAPIPLDEALALHPIPASNALSRAARQAADFLHVISGP